jgi:LysR family transcriptional activator of nhaA
MEWLNYHHLFYFWRIAREGGLSRAAESLRLTHSTLSAQLASLEHSLRGPLFERRGRRLVLTALGEQVASYADDIFRLGAELQDVAHGGSTERRSTLRIGVVGSIPKTVAYGLLQPAFGRPGIGPVVVRQDNMTRLLEELAAARLHAILSDSPAPEPTSHKVFAHALGESGVLVYGAPALRKRYGDKFPRSIGGAPWLLPTRPSSLRRQLDRWFQEHRVQPTIEGEFDDAGLMRVFGVRGHGLFPVRAALRAEVEDSKAVDCLGELDGGSEKYFIISVERRVRHHAVSAIVEEARVGLAKPQTLETAVEPASRTSRRKASG